MRILGGDMVDSVFTPPFASRLNEEHRRGFLSNRRKTDQLPVTIPYGQASADSFAVRQTARAP
jgi:hypothetical protein